MIFGEIFTEICHCFKQWHFHRFALGDLRILDTSISPCTYFSLTTTLIHRKFSKYQVIIVRLLECRLLIAKAPTERINIRATDKTRQLNAQEHDNIYITPFLRRVLSLMLMMHFFRNTYSNVYVRACRGRHIWFSDSSTSRAQTTTSRAYFLIDFLTFWLHQAITSSLRRV